MIKVMIVDDQALIREELNMMLSLYENIEIVDEANNGKEAIEKIEVNEVDVAENIIDRDPKKSIEELIENISHEDGINIELQFGEEVEELAPEYKNIYKIWSGSFKYWG